MGRVHQGNLALKQRPHSGKRLPLRRRSYGRVLYNRFRYFDPAVGRYINADPIGQWGGTNVFQYVLPNPTVSIDPLGLAGGPYGLGGGPYSQSNTVAQNSSPPGQFGTQAASNFRSTNTTTPGVAAPIFLTGASGIAGNVAASRGANTVLGLGKLVLTNPGAVTSGAVVGTAQAAGLAWAATSAAWFAGTAVGSAIAAIPVPGGPGATVGTFYGDYVFDYLNPPPGSCSPGAGTAVVP